MIDFLFPQRLQQGDIQNKDHVDYLDDLGCWIKLDVIAQIRHNKLRILPDIGEDKKSAR